MVSESPWKQCMVPDVRKEKNGPWNSYAYMYVWSPDLERKKLTE